jgi:hypothetical protein
MAESAVVVEINAPHVRADGEFFCLRVSRALRRLYLPGAGERLRVRAINLDDSHIAIFLSGPLESELWRVASGLAAKLSKIGSIRALVPVDRVPSGTTEVAFEGRDSLGLDRARPLNLTTLSGGGAIFRDIERAFEHLRKIGAAPQDGSLPDAIENLIDEREDILSPVCAIEHEAPPSVSSRDGVPDGYYQTHGSWLLEEFECDSRDGNASSHGLDSYSTYRPIHFHRGKLEHDARWGVVVLERGIHRLAARLWDALSTQVVPEDRRGLDLKLFNLAAEILRRYQFARYKAECFSIYAEMLMDKPLYFDYLIKVYLLERSVRRAVEDQFACDSVTNSRRIGAMAGCITGSQSTDVKSRVKGAAVDCVHKIMSLLRGPHGVGVQDIGVVLCNQIVAARTVTTEKLIPFNLFPINNFFLRAESLVPIWMIR